VNWPLYFALCHATELGRKLRGSMVDAAAVESEWSAVLRTVRAGMLAVPSRCAAQGGAGQDLWGCDVTGDKIAETTFYENHKLCPTLQRGEICIVVEQYHEGKFERQFHEHVPRSRLSAEGKINLLRALVVRFHGFTGMGAEQIVRAHLNSRGKVPSKNVALQIHTSYSEPGVLRQSCGGDTAAWADEVIAPSSFRQR
jgi:hypothetical protein